MESMGKLEDNVITAQQAHHEGMINPNRSTESITTQHLPKLAGTHATF
jgi:hypothetical protein